MSDPQDKTPAPDIEIRILRLGEAADLAPLIAAYNKSLFSEAPGTPDVSYAEKLLQDRTAEVLGARLDGVLVGFVVFYDIPDLWTGMRSGLADHIYVDEHHRRKGIAKAMIDLLAEEADPRGWSKLVLHSPRNPEAGRQLYERVAAPADWKSFVVRFSDRSLPPR
ncbi:GCN5-related N-acetyltransferase [Fulvimarina pelagi HTCC2506]|uniref:GCN5-related N-acetyltransferase n=2 Tax=Fulvimarina pelagi TaxID=217511 RepID=Q0FZL7_9HYPH|nr:GNAT family N-acetyltransferase [Fulvimarina pelagi]EAU40574.1 GCN5-related N-acetyltransferase [Fulvimarina pelagi HTCC2506]BAT31595.1 GCN5-related N-acetyltransferase [Fulvimarina pelagi]